MAFYKDLNYLMVKKEGLLEDLDTIIQSVYSILGTKKGSRLFRPTWGGSLTAFLFEPCDELTANSMLYEIVENLSEDPRIKLNMSKTFVTPDPTNSQFFIQLCLDVPGFSEYERTISLTFKQKDQGV